MGNKKETVYRVNNDMELIVMNIALGNESYRLEKEHRELVNKIIEVEEKIINKIARANSRKGFVMVMLSPKKERM